MNSKKGAMFGLDARIALAIFGVLSVIFGAALYSAIKDAKVVAIITEMDNIDKAVTSYMLDTGSYIPLTTHSEDYKQRGFLKARELLESSAIDWKGPYITIEENGSNDYRIDIATSTGSYWYIYLIRKNDNSNWQNLWIENASSKCILSSPSCSIYICYERLTKEILSGIDVKVDGKPDSADLSKGGSSGNFRYHSDNGCKKGMIYDKNLTPAS